MKTLILSDIHENMRYVRAAEKLAAGADHVVCLGDYWDSWNGFTQDTQEITDWVKEKAQDSKWTLLLGNHDMHYLFPKIREFRCSGWDQRRARVVDRAGINPEDFSLFAHIFGISDRTNWLLSHAGLASQLLPPSVKDVYDFGDWILQNLSFDAWENLRQNKSHPLLEAGESRGGNNLVGGITWADWSEMDTLPWYQQLVGHSAGKEIRNKDNRTYCMDTNQRHFAWIENGEIHFELASGAANG